MDTTELSSMQSAVWRLLDTGFSNPGMNMAVDEALIQELTDAPDPILRFFDWSVSSITIGYNQRINTLLKTQLCKKENIAVIRRPTGGGVVFHGVDITYSVVLPKRFVRNHNIKDMFLWIQSGIRNGFLSLGIDAWLYTQKERIPMGYCFISPSISDIMAGNRKIAGLAGRRKAGNILCQGYIYFQDASYMAKFLKKKNSLEKAVSVCELLGGGIDKSVIKKAIIKNWPNRLEKSSLTSIEQNAAGRLYEGKYSKDIWNYKR